MIKVDFPFSVKHKGRFYAAHETFEADDSEADTLTKIGGKIVDRAVTRTRAAPASKAAAKSSGRSKPYKIPSPAPAKKG